MIETARRLQVLPIEAGELHVDASDLLPDDDSGPRYWRLHWEEGEWHHWPSGTHGTLGEQLIGIASCYVARPPRRT